MSLQGRPLLAWAVDGLISSGVVDEVVVIVPADFRADAAAIAPAAHIVDGGDQRTDSVRAGLARIGRHEHVLVHDAARPLTPPPLIARVVAELVTGAGAVIPVLPVTDTIKRVDAAGAIVATVDRSALRAVQTPQGFRADLLRTAYAAADEAATDDAGLVERAGGTVITVPGDPLALKITTAFDLAVAHSLVGAQ